MAIGTESGWLKTACNDFRVIPDWDPRLQKFMATRMSVDAPARVNIDFYSQLSFGNGTRMDRQLDYRLRSCGTAVYTLGPKDWSVRGNSLVP